MEGSTSRSVGFKGANVTIHLGLGAGENVMVIRRVELDDTDTRRRTDETLAAGNNFLLFSCERRQSLLYLPKQTFVVRGQFCGVPEPWGERGRVNFLTPPTPDFPRPHFSDRI